MNLLDFENKFSMEIYFDGDSECDVNCLTVKREMIDSNGSEFYITEEVYLSTNSLVEIAKGLKSALIKIEKHLS